MGAVVIAIVVACGSSDPPVVPGFACGAFGGTCPPASKCVMEPCDHNDCPTSCVATTPCDPAHDACPNATACDGSTRYCMPRKICQTNADCRADEVCLTGSSGPFSHPICGRA